MEIILKNIGIIEKANISINGLTVIAGNNDSGKSTVGKIAYSLTKSFENFELDYEKSKSELLERYFRQFYIILREGTDLKNNSELLHLTRKFMVYRKVDNKILLELMTQLKNLINKKEIAFNEKTKKELYDNFNNIESLFKKKESKNIKIIKSINNIFTSEFKHKINNFSQEDSTISVLEGENKIIDLIIKNNEIITSKEIDEIFPFENSIFIETPFILTYEDALEEYNEIYHVHDLLNKLQTPTLNKEYNILNISKIIEGEIIFDDKENSFSFRKKIGGKINKIPMLNSASGIKSLGILQILDKLGEFNKNLLLVIDEPEVHLHPDWQVEYAKLLVQLVKHGVKVLVTSHSPYLIEALNKFSKDEKLEDNTKFYLSESTKEGKSIIIDKTKDKSEIFKKLSEPFNKLIWN